MISHGGAFWSRSPSPKMHVPFGTQLFQKAPALGVPFGEEYKPGAFWKCLLERTKTLSRCLSGNRPSPKGTGLGP